MSTELDKFWFLIEKCSTYQWEYCSIYKLFLTLCLCHLSKWMEHWFLFTTKRYRLFYRCIFLFHEFGLHKSIRFLFLLEDLFLGTYNVFYEHSSIDWIITLFSIVIHFRNFDKTQEVFYSNRVHYLRKGSNKPLWFTDIETRMNVLRNRRKRRELKFWRKL